MLLAAGRVWTFWMGVLIFVPILLTTIAVGVGYLLKVVRPKYPPRGADRS